MSMKRADVIRGAYIEDGTGLYLVLGVHAGKGGVTDVTLSDESSPTSSPPMPDGRSLPMAPDMSDVPLHKVQRDFRLVMHAPNPADIATVEEWGAGG